jgi:hypothetical protein
MTENRLPDYIDHIQLAATDACSFVDSLGYVPFDKLRANRVFRKITTNGVI